MSYILRADDTELFEAKIKITGASLNESFARLLIESQDWNLVFKGDISKDGTVQIPIKKLKRILPEGTVGKMKLEVVADDAYFVPWESDFEVIVSKEVVAEVKQQQPILKPGKPKVEVLESKQPAQAPKKVVKKKAEKLSENRKIYLKEFMKELVSAKITISNLNENHEKVNKITTSLLKKHKLNESTTNWIIEQTLKLLERRAMR